VERNSDACLALKELRSQQARDLADVLRKSAAIRADPTYIPRVPPLSRDRRFPGKYGELGERLYLGYALRGDATGDEHLRALSANGLTQHGCYVLTRIMSKGPEAYANYSQAQPDHQPSVTELGEIMNRSSAILKTFADISKKDNTTIETAFGLLQYPPLYDDVPPFEVRQSEQGKLEFGASPIILERAKLEALKIRLNEDLPVAREPGELFCPAIGMVLDTFWTKGIESCISDPDLFAADLAAYLPDTPIAE
jgi:hypothetical protein